MGIKRIVDTVFWTDTKVLDKYSPEDKYFLLYLMTNPNTTQVGIYKLPKKMMSFHTGYTLDSILVLLDRFENQYQNIIYSHKTQEVAVLNSLKYSIVKGGKPVSDLLRKELSQIKDDELVLRVYRNMIKFWNMSTRVFDSTVKGLFEEDLEKRKIDILFNENEMTMINDNDNDNDNDNEESYHDSYHDSLEERENDEPDDDSFDIFWKAYPKKVDKKASRRAWKKIRKKDIPLIMEALEVHKKQRSWQNRDFIKGPAGWLNGEKWNDEIDPSKLIVDPEEKDYTW